MFRVDGLLKRVTVDAVESSLIMLDVMFPELSIVKFLPSEVIAFVAPPPPPVLAMVMEPFDAEVIVTLEPATR